MGSIVCQTAIGAVGSKAVTEASYSFCSMVNTGAYQYGMNKNGIFRLNVGETDDDAEYSREFTIATSDFGIKNPKRCRYLYIGYEADEKFDVYVRFDGGEWKSYPIKKFHAGIHRLRLPIGSKMRGMYMSLKIVSSSRFRIDHIKGIFTILSLGKRGY